MLDLADMKQLYVQLGEHVQFRGREVMSVCPPPPPPTPGSPQHKHSHI